MVNRTPGMGGEYQGPEHRRVQPTGPHVRSIIIVRHGRTAYNEQHRLQGQVDIPLDEVGEWQVRQTAQTLRDLYVDGRPDIPKQLVVCSDLGRAVQTAHAFADPLGLDVHPDARVRERSFGAWEGLRLEVLERDFTEDYQSWRHFAGGELKHGAEPKGAVGERGVEAIDDWSHRAGPDTTLFVFSHGAWISQTLQTLLGMAQGNHDFGAMTSMFNAHWARLTGADQPDGTVRWRMTEYNHGPAIADTDQWEAPTLH